MTEIYGTTTADKYSDIAVSVKTFRIIYRCKNKNCKHTWAKEYRKVYRQMGETKWNSAGKSYRIEEVSSYIRMEDGKKIFDFEDDQCPLCTGKSTTSSIVHGTYSADHKCDARCVNAKGGDCECQCGGKLHGTGWL